MRRAVELGVTLFDTAEIYNSGRSERILGRALDEQRESVVIADKIFPLIPMLPLVTWHAKASAKRLGASRLDLYQSHYPNPLVSDRSIMRGMRKLRDAGVVGEVGVSNYSVARWRAAEGALGGRILSNQVEYNLLNRSAEQDVLPFAEAGGRVVIAFCPLAQGLLSGRYGADRPADRVRATSSFYQPERMKQAEPVIRVLREVADAHRATPAQIALAWTIRPEAVVAIPGASSVEQLESNVAAAEIRLGDDEYEALRAVSSWARETGPQRPLPRRRLSELRHCALAGRHLAMTLRQDLRRASSARD